LAEIVSRIADSKVAEYYRREFGEKVFETFKRRQYGRGKVGPGHKGSFRPPLPLETVSPAVRNSLLARSGRTAAVRLKEVEVAGLLLAAPQLASQHGELLAALPFSEPSLDRLRHELLNLAASGSRLESQWLETHLVRSGMAELIERLHASRLGNDHGCETASGDNADEIEARFLCAVAQLREMAEREPERKRAVDRFNAEATEDNWHDAKRLIAPRVGSGE
jgi:DNA primase